MKISVQKKEKENISYLRMHTHNILFSWHIHVIKICHFYPEYCEYLTLCFSRLTVSDSVMINEVIWNTVLPIPRFAIMMQYKKRIFLKSVIAHYKIKFSWDHLWAKVGWLRLVDLKCPSPSLAAPHTHHSHGKGPSNVSCDDLFFKLQN